MSAKTDRFDRSRRNLAISVTIIVALLSAAAVAGMIYLYYQTVRLHV